jgi:hypothetical protein
MPPQHIVHFILGDAVAFGDDVVIVAVWVVLFVPDYGKNRHPCPLEGNGRSTHCCIILHGRSVSQGQIKDSRFR